MSVSRYLHKNIEQMHERRRDVKKLKDQLAALQQELEWQVIHRYWADLKISGQTSVLTVTLDFIYSYRNYGSGPTKYPLADMLQFVLEFATTKPINVTAAEDPRPSSPSPSQPGQPVGEATSQDTR